MRDELLERVAVAEAGGIDRDRIVLDPGIGFGKTAGRTSSSCAPPTFCSHRLPDPGGRQPQELSRRGGGDDSPPGERLGGSLAAADWSARLGAAVLRVHDVAPTAQFLRVMAAIDRSATSEIDA